MNPDHPAPASASTLFWNRVQLIMVLVVFTAPIAGAFFYKPTGYINYGDLYVPVREVEDLTLVSESGAIALDSLRRQWVFLVTADAECGVECEANILKIRQLRFMQNQDMTRIRTVFVHTSLAPAVAADLRAKYHPMEVYSVDPEQFNAWRSVLVLDKAPKAANKDRIYIIDPAGNLMMSYPAGADPSLMKKDIKRLLKTSQIG